MWVYRININNIKVFVSFCIVMAACSFAIECRGSEIGRSLIEFPVKPAAPALILPDKDGNTIDISMLEDRVIVLNFWATWCPSCVSEMRAMHETAIELSAKDVIVISINVGENHYKITNFFRDYQPSYKVLADYQSHTIDNWQIQGLPTTYVIGPDRKIHLGAIGALAWKSDKVKDQILGLLN